MNFNIDEHKDCFKTEKDEACFWHGQTDGVGGQENAREIASENDWKTLEMCMLENRDELEQAGVEFQEKANGGIRITYGENAAEENKFFDDCSRSFAEQASGDVHTIEGSDPRPNGQAEQDYPHTYNRVEHPTLDDKTDVNSITAIDPKTREETGKEVRGEDGKLHRENENLSNSETDTNCLSNFSKDSNSENEPSNVDKGCLFSGIDKEEDSSNLSKNNGMEM